MDYEVKDNCLIINNLVYMMVLISVPSFCIIHCVTTPYPPPLVTPRHMQQRSTVMADLCCV